MHFTRKLFIGVLLVMLAVGFAGGFVFYKYQIFESPNIGIRELINRDTDKPSAVDFSLFWQTWETLHDKYVEKGDLDTQALVYGAISGMVRSVGDPYTEFFEPSISKKFQEQISGSFSGVGMEIGKRNNVLTVIAPLRNTPASRAGIQAGDRIIKINEQLTDELAVDEAVSLIRGKKGTKVRLVIQPAGSQETRELELIRDTIKVPAVELKMINDKTAYLTLSQFSQNVDGEFADAAEEILNSGAEKLIVDLRNNPGGLLDSAVNIAGWFLKRDSLVVIEDFGNGTHNEFRAAGNSLLSSLKTVFIVNGGSASASEILAGAVHDNRNTILIGEQTFGKGSVQELDKYGDGSSLKVTVAKWLTPNGVSISEKGIEPDIKVVIDPKLIEDNTVEFGIQGKDPQLDKAIELLK